MRSTGLEPRVYWSGLNNHKEREVNVIGMVGYHTNHHTDNGKAMLLIKVIHQPSVRRD